jgi:hypothetical protein
MRTNIACPWAFSYAEEENRFDPPELIKPGEPFIKNAG